ncbi:putative uncharacterized protein DDB_G0270496 [Helianthus annuus]|uniref:putative uncharacterized protein DDB_G0270496 n=1 Tax=Helianthus annuus TaxID=4232 RepID=UPI000B900CFB|nr:putative uncharacterized protein DDB_G0270496 [Helianthus annuus]
MKYKGKGVEGVSDVSERAIIPSSVSESPVQNPRPISVVSEVEEDDEDKTDDAGDVFSASSHSDDDNDDDGEGGTGVKVTEASNEENVDDYLHDDVNEEPEDATSEGENVDDQNVDKREKLILRLEPEVEEDYQYKYVEEADNYDRVEVEDCSDEENVNADTSNFPTLVEFFSQANVDELRRKVAECLKDKDFDGTTKDAQREEC